VSPLWLTEAGSVPTHTFFIERLRLFFSPEIASQSMRAGGATALAEHGVSPAVIQASGCWASEAFLIYIRKNPTLIQGLLYATAHTSTPSSPVPVSSPVSMTPPT
jgi:hypothetical protein